MEPIVVKTDNAPRPGGWYSQAFIAGDFVFTAGVTANDPVTQQLIWNKFCSLPEAI